MDIQRWLDETVLPEQPPSDTKRQKEASNLLVGKLDQAPKEKRQRKSSTVDSSLLEAQPQRKRTPPALQADLDGSVDESMCSDASHFSTSSESSPLSQPYARRPRRKTRLERYEPALMDVKEQGTHTRRRRKGESSRKKRKHNRKKDKLSTGIVQGFQAKNVSKDRLTLKPREKLGLFSKGRASTPVKGRGLPDLVFSEMKFLQSHKGHPEAEPRTDLPKKKRKANQTHAKEEAISAYFTSVRPALAEKDVDGRAKEVFQRQLQEIDRQEDGQKSVIDNAIPTVELADQASYLGFGSRGPRHESRSYISWSESVRTPSATPARPQIATMVHTGQLDSVHNEHERGDTENEDALHSRPAPQTVAQCIEGSGSRFQVSSLALANDRGSPYHSLPQHAPSPGRMNLVDRAAKCATIESIVSPSSMASFVPGNADSQSESRRPTNNAAAARFKGTLCSGVVQGSVGSARVAPSHERRRAMKTDVDPQTSSTLGRILEDCNAAFHEQRQAAATLLMNLAVATPSRTHLARRDSNHQGPYPTIERIPTVRFADVDEIHRPRRPGASAASIYEQPQERNVHIQQQDFDDEHSLQAPFMIDNGYIDEGEGYTAHEWGGQPEGGLYDAEFDSLSEEDFVEQLGIGNGRGNTTLRSDIVANAGFWRPHKLY